MFFMPQGKKFPLNYCSLVYSTVFSFAKLQHPGLIDLSFDHGSAQPYLHLVQQTCHKYHQIMLSIIAAGVNIVFQPILFHLCFSIRHGISHIFEGSCSSITKSRK